MVAVCRMAPQGAHLKQASLWGIVALQVVQQALVGPGHTASQRYTSRDHPGSVACRRPPSSSGKGSRLVKVANTNSRGNFLIFETNRAVRNYRGVLLCAAAQSLGLDCLRGFFVPRSGQLSIQSCDNSW